MGNRAIDEGYSGPGEPRARFAALNVEGVSPAIDVTQKSTSVEEVDLRLDPGGQATLRIPRHTPG